MLVIGAAVHRVLSVSQREREREGVKDSEVSHPSIFHMFRGSFLLEVTFEWEPLQIKSDVVILLQGILC